MEFSKWMEQDRGVEWAEALEIKAHQTVKWSKQDKEAILEALLTYIENNEM